MPDQPAPDLPESENQRVVHVFISSTFRDMHEERNYLVKHISSRISGSCANREALSGAR